MTLGAVACRGRGKVGGGGGGGGSARGLHQTTISRWASNPIKKLLLKDDYGWGRGGGRDILPRSFIGVGPGIHMSI